MHRQRYTTHPEFNGLGEMVWKYLNSEGKIVSEVIKSETTKLKPINEKYRKKPVWHTKPDLDKFVEKSLNLKLSDYGEDLAHNSLYKAIAGEIKYFRDNNLIVDLHQTKDNSKKGIWRLAKNAEVKSLVKDEMKVKNFHSSGKITTVYVREKQDDFRRILLKQYKECLFCKFKSEKYMIGAHIIPYHWMRKHDPNNSMNPENGLLLCSLCDVAFEVGDIQVENDYGITITRSLQKSENPTVESWIENIQPEMNIGNVEFKPNVSYLERKKRMVKDIKNYHIIYKETTQSINLDP